VGRVVRICHVTQGFLNELSPVEQGQVLAEFHALSLLNIPSR
jgi:hypothetical protein